MSAECKCPPCPGRGTDGHGMNHCAECCFGSGVEADMDCPKHGQPMTDATELDEAGIRARVEAATPGPWHWAGNTDTGEPYLAAWLPGIGRCSVLAIGEEARKTTGREADRVRSDAEEFDLGDPEELVHDWATDRFGEPIKDPRLWFYTDLMADPARDHVVYEVAPDATSREDRRVYRADITGIRHPDAEFIAHARTDLPAALDEITRLRAALDEARAERNEDVDGRILRLADRYKTRAEAAESALAAVRALARSWSGRLRAALDEARADAAAANGALEAAPEILRLAEMSDQVGAWKTRAEAAESALAAVRALARSWSGRHDLLMTGDSAAHDIEASLAANTTTERSEG